MRVRIKPLHLPVVLCCAVAVTQLLLSRFANLDPWKGGGFGMFATIDKTQYRFLKCSFVERDGFEQPARCGAASSATVLRARTMPSASHLLSVAREVAWAQTNKNVCASRVQAFTLRMVSAGALTVIPIRAEEHVIRKCQGG